MELGPKIMGKKNKSIRVDPSQLAAFREELKDDPEWSSYATATDSELVRVALIFGRLHVLPDVYVLRLADVNHIVGEAVRNAISGVATALGGVAQMNQDNTISVTKPESASIETFQAKPVRPKRIPTIN